jgi:proton-dependent oligopeptide transporter, POT family
MQRSIGCDAPIGSVYAVNPAMIIILVPLVTAATSRVSHFDMVHAGSYVSASSSFWAYALTTPQLLGPLLFVVQLSLGEAVWSPRWYDYTMDVAPEGAHSSFRFRLTDPCRPVALLAALTAAVFSPS